ncbi:MAG TPA: 6,7-dimethyl-8-ribityllumazine synthase [Candidatus Eisenbacteria bacterium]|nr:6,7-dimethyl-8-ribityllumazine synthase [Candidatus Eisenbacteria bacterium]
MRAARPGSGARRSVAGPREGRRLEGSEDGAGLSIGIVLSRFNLEIGERLLNGARRALGEAGVSPGRIDEVRVPGAFELPWTARAMARSARYDAIVCLGAVVRGGTPHFDFVAGEAARGIARVSEETGVPVLFGVLTTDTMEQAMERSGGPMGNRGADAALAAVEMGRLARAFRAEYGR